MASNISDYLVTDDLTILLGLIGATVFLLRNLYKPQPLVHPILLGRQSDVARVRNPNESAVYRNYGTGLMGRFPLRPAKDVQTTADFVKIDSDAPRTLWSTKITNSRLQERISAFGTGLIRLAGLQPNESNVLLALNDGLEFLITDLALASYSIHSLTLSSLTLMSPVLEAHPLSVIITHAEFVSHILELIYDADGQQQYTIIVVGEPTSKTLASVSSKVKVLLWSDVERDGTRADKAFAPQPKPSDVYTTSFFATKDGQVHGAELTHENFTAGVAAVRALLPLSNTISPLDTIVSSHSLSTAYGRAIAYTAIYEGTSFATLDSSKIYVEEDAHFSKDVKDVRSAMRFPIPPPTILFINPDHLKSLTSSILGVAKKSWLLFSIAWRHKIAGLTEGFVTKDSLWDRLLFDTARARVVDECAGSLRGIVVAGGRLDASELPSARIALSIPIVNAYVHPAVTAPVLASHPLDLQEFPDTADKSAHVGPPSINLETKLTGVDDASVEAGGDPVGLLLVRGPPVGKVVGLSSEAPKLEEDWIATGEQARVQTNGSFKILS
ncbi:hypothetical protein PLEOSDRAFT_1091549 [Pleurotus ostreatus PC15]|uniref:Uncharacterized protein n=1 Tax=Pleurotus ostreatus (strain PC15) TaxID=1137138 RepID=A0A067PAX5_PLEO1|nr:hypothetical protein PLEOSDRAFT_1091549 [Pleurotus ostreatus PC15]